MVLHYKAKHAAKKAPKMLTQVHLKEARYVVQCCTTQKKKWNMTTLECSISLLFGHFFGMGVALFMRIMLSNIYFITLGITGASMQSAGGFTCAQDYA